MGSNLQEKLGSILLDGNLGILGNLVVATGSPQVGDVLTALDATGTVGWAAPSYGGGTTIITGEVESPTGTTTATLSLPSGVWTLNVISTTFECQIAPASLKLDGVVIGSYTGTYEGDTEGCNELTIDGSANNVSSGSHTFTYYFNPYIDQSWPNGHSAQFSWIAYKN